MSGLTLTYSLADQNFNQTKSLGIFNLSTQLLENLALSNRLARLSVLSNSTLNGRLRLPQEAVTVYHNEAISSKFKRILWDQRGVYQAANNSRNQWLFLPKGFASFLRKPDFKLAVYIHDTIHDFYQANYPGAMPWLECKYFIGSLKQSLRYANVIFTNSDFTKDQLERLAFRFNLNLPLVVTAGIGFNRAKQLISQKQNSLLLLSSAWPHKLTKQAVNFIQRWMRQVGFSGTVNLVGSLPREIDLAHLADWRCYPRLSEAVYKQFLAEAKVLLFFSSYEGFGMPPMEAMISGTCPVFSDLPVTREVMGNSGYSFLNNSYESFAESMNKALSVTQTQIEVWSEQLLQRHNWDKVVERIINGLTQISK